MASNSSINASDLKDSKKLKSLTTKRGFVRQKITKLCSKIDTESINFSPQQINMNLNKCNTLKEEIALLDDELLTLCIDLG